MKMIVTKLKIIFEAAKAGYRQMWYLFVETITPFTVDNEVV